MLIIMPIHSGTCTGHGQSGGEGSRQWKAEDVDVDVDVDGLLMELYGHLYHNQFQMSSLEGAMLGQLFSSILSPNA